MFTDPLVLSLNGEQISAAIVSQSPNQTIRKGTTSVTLLGVTLTLGESPTRENPAAGGSVRHLIRTDIPVGDADGKNLGSATALTILVKPNNGVNVDVLLKHALQSNISFLLAENDGTLDAVAQVDDTTFSRFISGEG